MSVQLVKSVTGRPSKLTIDFIQATQDVLSQDKSLIILTDSELVDEINECLEPECRITNRTYQRWKAKSIAGEFGPEDSLGEEFCRLYKKALREQKKALMVAFSTDPLWTRWAWILERKFDEWNLKKITQVDVTSKGESLNKLSDQDLDSRLQTLLDK